MKNSTQEKSRIHRWIQGSFGLLFVGLAAAILYTADRPVNFRVYLAAGVVGALGVDALVSAIRKRTSLLSFLGPLP